MSDWKKTSPALKYQYNIKQKTDENKAEYNLGDLKWIQY